MDVVAAVRRGAGGLGWFLRGVVREDAYERYCEHVRQTHGGPPMTAREFWREQTDRQDRAPEGRCC